MNFDFNFDFDIDEFSLNTKTKKRLCFNLEKSADILSNIEFPKKMESLRLISPANGWSSCSVLIAISEKYKIKNIFLTTLRVGKKEMDALCEIKDLHNCNVKIVMGGIAKENGKYKYSEYIEEKAKEKNIKVDYVNNHSKVILLDCYKDKFVIETSSNFNENPKIEQFVITNSSEIYDFYIEMFLKLGLLKEGE